MKVLAVINPTAGRGRGERLRRRARAELSRLLPDIEFVETERPGHAVELAAASRHELLVSVGGDGTLRELAAGIVGRESVPVLALVPVGSGNDLARGLGITDNIESACRTAVEGRIRPLDAARLADDDRQTVFVNAAGFGFDARVIQEARRLRHLRGMPLYLSAVLMAVRRFDCPQARITVGTETIDRPILLVAVANGCCYGGGMKVAPQAEPDDGRLEVCVINAVGRAKILRYLPKLVRGTHGRLAAVRFLSGPGLEIEFSVPVPVQLDGDLLDWPGARRFRIDIIPRALRVRVP